MDTYNQKNLKSEKFIELISLTKDFIGVRALDDVSIEIKRGEIHSIVGENGAGKSTLIKTIVGALEPTSGKVIINGNIYDKLTPKVSSDEGIGVVYQEFNLFQNLKVYENIFFGIEKYNQYGILDKDSMIRESKQILNDLKVDIDPNKKVAELTTAYQQMIEISKCLIRKTDLIIMDEPSAPLTENEISNMFEVVKTLNKRGVTIIYISHKLNEVFELSDRITVLRDGKKIKTIKSSTTNQDELISLMVGRKIENIYPNANERFGEVIMNCQNLTSSKINNVSFSLKRGEILGFGGLVGAGRTELMRLLFGADKMIRGEIEVKGKKTQILSPSDAIRLGIGFIPEDRKLHGIILNKSVLFNVLLPNLNQFVKTILKIINFSVANIKVRDETNKLSIKYSNLNQLTMFLSGGNQQKVIISKWLLRNCDILILDEPTRGIDVGSKQEIYKLLNNLAKAGKAIIVVSSEMPELLGLSNRVLVMHNGKVTGEVLRENFSQERVLELASR